MTKTGILDRLQRLSEKIEWKLLVFLILFLNVKLGIKLSGIILIYVLQFDFKFRIRSSRILLFYISMIILAIVNKILTGRFSDRNENIMFLLGMFYWSLCILAFHQLRLFTEKNTLEKLQFTLLTFFLLNAFISYFSLLLIIWETKSLNPYQFQGLYQKYFMGTGDKIYGISFDVSTTNALINAMGILYFIRKNNIAMSLLCMTVVLLTGSNFTNILLTVVLLFVFFFQSTREQKSLIILLIFTGVIFISRVSPENNKYVIEYFNLDDSTNINSAQKEPGGDDLAFLEKPDSLLSGDEKKQKFARLYLDSLVKELRFKVYLEEIRTHNYHKYRTKYKIRPSLPPINLNDEFFQRKNEIVSLQAKLLEFEKQEYRAVHLNESKYDFQRSSGKLISFRETIDFFKAHPAKVLMGAGMGNFSSKLAFKTAALGIGGYYPIQLRYINDDFLKNHLAVFIYYFSKDAHFHSISNTPHSVFNQLLAEYGILGIFAYLTFYLGWFLKRRKAYLLLPFLFLLNGCFLMDYWFEQLSVIVIFELIMLISIKESEQDLELSHARN
jgi:O-Antigen ligase